MALATGTTTGITLTSTGTAVSAPIPFDAVGYFPRYIKVTSSAPAYVCVSNDRRAAVAGDVLVQPYDLLVLRASGHKSVSALSLSGTAVVSVIPDDSGFWTADQSTMELNFAQMNTLDPRVTFTRASIATRTNNSGFLETVGNNVARFDFDPVTKLPKGLLIEEARTNLLLNSDSLSTQGVTVTATPYTLSFYGSGTVTLSGAYSGTLVGSGAYPTRSTLTFTPSAGTLTCTVTGTVQYAQVEAGAFATSYIPTTGATVTRALDSAVMTGTNFSSWYNQISGAFLAEFSLPFNATGGAGLNAILSADDNTTAERIQVRRQDVSGLIAGVIVDNSVSVFGQGVAGAPVIAANTVTKAAIAYALNDCNLAQGGLIGATDTAATMPTPTQLQIGNGAGLNYLCGHIKRIAYYAVRMSNADLQRLTT